METFPKDPQEALEQSKTLLIQLKEKLPSSCFGTSPQGEPDLPWLVSLLNTALGYRIVEISETAHNLYESENLLPAIILSRSAFETLMVAHRLNDRIHFSIVNNNFNELDEEIRKLGFGSKIKGLGFPAINIKTIVDSINKKTPGVKNYYDELSEISHPNWAGVLGIYCNLDWDKRSGTFGRNNELPEISKTAVPILSALKSFLNLYDDTIQTLPSFSKLCKEYLMQK